MKVENHRKAIARTLIESLKQRGRIFHKHVAFANETSSTRFNTKFDPESSAAANQHYQGGICSVTGLFFPDQLSEELLTCTVNGQYIWTGLWLDDPLKLDDEGHGDTLFPRWLAEVLIEQGMSIDDEDIY